MLLSDWFYGLLIALTALPLAAWAGLEILRFRRRRRGQAVLEGWRAMLLRGWAVVTVLFRPFPWEAPSPVTFAASVESLILLLLTITSGRRLLTALKNVRSTGYTAYALVYVVVFVATFASIGNFGILARERVQMLPIFFILLAATPRQRRPAAQPARYDQRLALVRDRSAATTE